MKSNNLLIRIIRISAILTIVISIMLILGRLLNDWQLVESTTEPGHSSYKVGTLTLWMLPVLWKSGAIKTLLHNIMIGLCFLGGVQIGILLLSNRKKLRKMHNDRIQPIGRKAASG
jgi:hypothetical protein